MWILPQSFLIKLDGVKPQSLKYQLLDRNVQMRILSRNLSFAVDLDKQIFSFQSGSNLIKICEISVFTGFLTLIILNVDFMKNFPIEVNQSKTKLLKCEFLSLYFQMWIVSKNLPKEMDRSKQRIFEMLIFINSVCLSIILNVNFIKNFPIEEDQTEQKFLIINLEQVFLSKSFQM